MITYRPSDAWERGTYYGRTITSTWDYDSTATFKFTGTAVYVWGAVRGEDEDSYSEDHRMEFTLDGKYMGNVYRTGQRKWVWDVLYFATSGLSDVEHTLVITYKGDGALDFAMDRLEYRRETQPSTTSAATSATTTTRAATATVHVTSKASGSVVTMTTTAALVNSDETSTGTSSSRSEQAEATSLISSDSPTSSTTSLAGSSIEAVERFTLSLANITTVDGNGELVTRTQTQFLRGGTIYTRPISSPTDTPIDDGGMTPSKSIPVGAVVGAVIGGMLLTATIALCCIVFRRHRTRAGLGFSRDRGGYNAADSAAGSRRSLAPLSIKSESATSPGPLSPPSCDSPAYASTRKNECQDQSLHPHTHSIYQGPASNRFSSYPNLPPNNAMTGGLTAHNAQPQSGDAALRPNSYYTTRQLPDVPHRILADGATIRLSDMTSDPDPPPPHSAHAPEQSTHQYLEDSGKEIRHGQTNRIVYVHGQGSDPFADDSPPSYRMTRSTVGGGGAL